MLVKVLAPGFYAREDMRAPVRVGIIAMVSNMLLNVALVFPFMTLFNMGHVGLALATSLSAWLNAGLLYRGLRRDAVLPEPSVPSKWLMQIGLASAAMTLALVWMLPGQAEWTTWIWWERAIQLGMLCLTGLGCLPELRGSRAFAPLICGADATELNDKRTAPVLEECGAS